MNKWSINGSFGIVGGEAGSRSDLLRLLQLQRLAQINKDSAQHSRLCVGERFRQGENSDWRDSL